MFKELFELVLNRYEQPDPTLRVPASDEALPQDFGAINRTARLVEFQAAWLWLRLAAETGDTVSIWHSDQERRGEIPDWMLEPVTP